jgi:GH25 family lysozyme M1 (1,4-beta-N-acetylmuramidase)
MPPQIKLPACYDTSYYEYIVDFAKVSPRPAFVCTKATEGSTIRDSKFMTYWADLKQDGIRRSCYHFHRKAVSAELQATNFINTVKAGGGATSQDYFVLDIEEGGETPNQVIAWLDSVERQYSNQIIIYSRKNLLDPLADRCTAAQLTRLKKYPLWIAAYPTNPDIYTELPASWRPPLLGEVWLWQYSENGIVPGITGEVDLNWIAPVFRAILGNVTTPADVITTPYNGVKRTAGTLYGWDYVLHEIDTTQVKIKSVYCSPLKTGSQVGAATGADMVFNAGENDRLNTINYTVCDGVVKVYRTSPQPSLMVTDAGTVKIEHRIQVEPIDQAFTGLRYIVGPLADPPAWSLEGHNRTCYGLTTAGKLLILCTEGAYPNQGWTLQQCREFMVAHGAVLAFDAGGGGDVTAWDKAKGLLIATQNWMQTYLPNFLTIKAKENQNMANGQAKENGGRTAKRRKTPSRWGIEISSVAPYSTIDFIKVVPTLDTTTYPLDEWFETPNGYVNYKIGGVEYFTITRQPSTDVPPPATFAHHLEVILDGKVEFTKDFN